MSARLTTAAALIALLLSSHFAAAQHSYTYWSAGVGLGTTQYQGDLDDHGFEPWRKGSQFLKRGLIKFGLNANIAYHFDPHLSARFSFAQGWISAADSLSNDPSRNYRNLHFRSSLSEFSLQLCYEFIANTRYTYYRRYRYRPDWSPYLFTGVALFHFRPKAQPHESWTGDATGMSKDEWVDLHELGTEGQNLPDETRTQYALPGPYNLWQFAIPIGIGVRRKLARRWDARFEISVRKTFTDYLDDVGGDNYAPPAELLKNDGLKSYLFADRSGYTNYGINRELDESRIQGAFRLTQNPNSLERRGDESNDDWYGFISVGVSYILTNKY